MNGVLRCPMLYSYVIPELKRQAADRIDDLLNER